MKQISDQPAASPATSTHRMLLAEGSWAIWRWSALRSAGFPIGHVLQLGAPELVATAADLAAEHDILLAAQDTLVQQLKAYARTITDEQRPRIIKLITAIRSDKPAKTPALPGDMRAALATYEQRRARYATATDNFQQTFVATMAEKSADLRDLVVMDRFHEALAWQNRQVLQTGVASFVRKPPTTTNDQYRKHRTTLAKYVQRYSTKNDTIGFFGPVSWVQWDETAAAATLHAGPQLIAQHTTYLESWGINLLAQRLAENPALLPWAIPRRLPFVHIAGTTLKVPFAPPIRIPAAQARVLQACDGTRTAKEIAHLVVPDALSGLMTLEDVWATLEKLVAMRRITWSFAVSQEDLFPERILRQRLDAIDDAALRAVALTPLSRLEDAKAAIDQAIGHPTHLESAIEHYETLFTELTGKPSTRFAGELYAGRTLLYQECRRDVAVTLGKAVFTALARPLELLLTSARWFTYEATQRFHDYFKQVYDELVQKHNTAQVEFAEFYTLINAVIFDPAAPTPPLIDTLEQEFQRRWAEVLALTPDRDNFQYVSADLTAAVAAAFPAPHSGWPQARFHCPDVMIAAADIAAINRGDFHIILGEVHIGINTLDAPVFVTNQPQSHVLDDAIAVDMPRLRIKPLIAEQINKGNRVQPIFSQPGDFHLLTSADVPKAHVANLLCTGDLIVTARAGHLFVSTRDGQRTFDIFDVFSDYLSLFAANSFSIFAKVPHRSRLAIDRVVVHRESWRFAADVAEFAFLDEIDHAAMFLSVCRWVRAHDLPRFVFLRTNLEKKPLYVDFTSPIAVEIFVKEVRRVIKSEAGGGFVSLSEMMPAPDQLWLTDAQGEHYTSEIRIVAVDMQSIVAEERA